jgi:hypothetical protein
MGRWCTVLRVLISIGTAYLVMQLLIEHQNRLDSTSNPLSLKRKCRYFSEWLALLRGARHPFGGARRTRSAMKEKVDKSFQVKLCEGALP